MTGWGRPGLGDPADRPWAGFRTARTWFQVAPNRNPPLAIRGSVVGEGEAERGAECEEERKSAFLPGSGRPGDIVWGPGDLVILVLFVPPSPSPAKPSSIDFSLHLYWRGELYYFYYLFYHLLYELLLFTWRFCLLLQV